MKKILNRGDIEQILPHRRNMLLLDRLIFESTERVWGEYSFKGDEWFFDGHFPEQPTVPGVILCEIMAQCACSLTYGGEKKRIIPLLTRIEQAEFHKMVKPGDSVRAEALRCDRHGVLNRFDCRLYFMKSLCASCQLTVFLKYVKQF